MQDLKRSTKKHGLCTGIGVDGCEFPEPLQKQNEEPSAQSSAGEDEKFPLSLFLRDEKGNYFVSALLSNGCTVEGIAVREIIILRQTIKPCNIDKPEPTVKDLCELAKKVHPYAEPIFWKGFWGGGIVTLLLLEKKRYNQTAELLRQKGVIMPDINQEISFVGESLKRDDEPDNRVNFVRLGSYIGSGKIKGVQEMLLVIKREKVDPMYR